MKYKEIISELGKTVSKSLGEIKFALYKAIMKIKTEYYRRKAKRINEKGLLIHRIKKTLKDFNTLLKEVADEYFLRH